ncbi:formate/nitrite transporter family protein [Maribacter sp. 2307ULW6-5]|uniref:formate/nitrite transporter family protein n=1 Tax=Maribacter sp. 2307ULW6-5 TaxID=3386275 RepID=UPI0039BD6BAB
MKNKEQKDHQIELEQKSSEVEAGKKHSDILSRVIHEGEEIFKLKSKSTFLSALIAGLEIGFSYVMICTLYELLMGTYPEGVVYKWFSLVYPIGFILVVLGKSALFTEQTSLLALPVLNGQRSLAQMFRVWGVVISGNLLGGILFSFFIAALAPALGLFTTETMAKVGTHIVDYAAWVILLSAIAAGWLMGLLTWLLNSTSNSLTRLTVVVIITGVIGFGGFHHSIVGNIEAFGALLYSDSISFLDYLRFLGLALLGNSLGGAVVVGLFKYRIFATNFYG